ncbi:MAG: non-canonical purine NTP pyrophosphatase, RdgB/HAM1 family [Pseudanabaena sp.]|nr:MAG: non-canonical purine NTP pyrophosphatase, RdgB/HAM1 family [Pseudanabaena sp.]
MQKLVIASGNAGKIVEFRDYFTQLGINLIPKPDDIDVEETGLTFMANAHLKAAQVAIATNEWAIADDSGLEIDALNGAPGVLSARYAETDQARIDRVLQELSNISNRDARYVCAIAIAAPDGEIFADAIGTCEGAIALAPVGQGGFGYDPIFFVTELQKTFGEVSLEVKAKISHRAKALLLLQSKLKTLL